MCIDVAESLSEGLAVELAAYGQVGLLPEEILAVIDGAVRIFRRVVEIQSRHLEHLASTLTVASCDQGSVYIDEILSPGRTCGWRMHIRERTRNTAWKVLVLGTQVGDGSHVLQAVTFLLKRIIRCGSALYWKFLLAWISNGCFA